MDGRLIHKNRDVNRVNGDGVIREKGLSPAPAG